MAVDLLVSSHLFWCGLRIHASILSGDLPKYSWGWIDQTSTMEYVFHDLLAHP